jgi:hypothetical protein
VSKVGPHRIKLSCASIQAPAASFWNSARSRPRDAVVDIFDSGLMAQLGIAQAGHAGAGHFGGWRGGKTPYRLAGAVAAQSTATTKRSRKRKADAAATPHFALSASPKPNSISGTPLWIPYGNKELALTLDARYRRGGWYAPPGADLSAFGERGWP